MRTFSFPSYLLTLVLAPVAVSTSATGVVYAQAAPAETSGASVLSISTLPKAEAVLRPALNNVTHALSSLSIGRWKTAGDIRSSTQQDASSIQGDLDNTLPGLISQADSSSASVADSFAVYRNVDALYDVLLRVAETARMAAPRAEAGNLDFALRQLEDARKTLGDGIMDASREHDAQLVKLQTALRAAAAQPVKPPTTTVVDDGPAPTATKPKHKHKTTYPTKQKQSPAPSQTTSPQPPQ